MGSNKEEVQVSYDVANDFFRLWLDERMNYTCAVFENDTQSLEAAQLNKLRILSDFAHVTPDGLTPSDRAAAQGYLTGAGENIANGYPTATAVMVAWMASAGHCRNILGSARDIGIGARSVLNRDVAGQKATMKELGSFLASNDTYYGCDAVMSPWIGNHDVGRPIHLAENSSTIWRDGIDPLDDARETFPFDASR